MKSKFWGKSLEFIPLSKSYIIIGDQHYVCTRPSTTANNIIFGTLYLDLSGTAVCNCPQTGVVVELKHKPRSVFSSQTYVVEGAVYDSDKNKVLEINGRWCESISVTNVETKEKTVVWEEEPQPENFADQHNFNTFALNVNNLTPELSKEIAPTDSRFRGDLRAFERGEIDEGAEGNFTVFFNKNLPNCPNITL